MCIGPCTWSRRLRVETIGRPAHPLFSLTGVIIPFSDNAAKYVGCPRLGRANSSRPTGSKRVLFIFRKENTATAIRQPLLVLLASRVTGSITHGTGVVPARRRSNSIRHSEIRVSAASQRYRALHRPGRPQTSCHFIFCGRSWLWYSNEHYRWARAVLRW